MNTYFLLRWISIISFLFFLSGQAISQPIPTASLKDSPTSIIGFNHIGISVANLSEMVAFYERATNFEIIKREKVSNHPSVDKLFGRQGVAYETVTFRAPNMLLELTEFAHEGGVILKNRPPEGPGMTHTCFQSPSWESGYNKFEKAGIEMLSRGSAPVDLGGYGVTYAYGYDPEGNMLEMEQLSRPFLKQTQMDSLWVAEHKMWMTQVAILSPNLKNLVDYYQEVLGFHPNRTVTLSNNLRLDDIIDKDNVEIHATWFKMDGYGKMLELMQYSHPETPSKLSKRDPTALGYTFSLEVDDIGQEYNRLSDLGVQFISEPQYLGEFWIVLAHDLDGNVFSLRQTTSEASLYSLKNFHY